MMTEQTTELELFYSKDGVLVRESCMEDIYSLQHCLKISDIDEVWASHHKTPYEALCEGFLNSDQCFSVVKEDKTLAMFGCCRAEDDKSTIWFLSGDEIFKIKRFAFIKHSAGFIGFMFHRDQSIKVLYNFVDVRNKISIRWLQRIGANIHEAAPYGIEGMPFHYFCFERQA